MKSAKTPSAWEREGLITEVGDSVGAAREMIDGQGLALAPGIIDTHASLRRADLLGSHARPVVAPGRED